MEISKITLEADQTYLRSFQPSDSVPLFDMLQRNTERLQESFPVTLNKCKSLSTVQIFIQQESVQRSQKNRYSFGVFESKTNLLIGYMSVKNIDWTVPKCELAYFIDVKSEGKGIISENIYVLRNWCFTKLGMNRIFLRILENNKASQRIAEKAGFILEGVHRKDFKTFSGELKDVGLWAVVR